MGTIKKLYQDCLVGGSGTDEVYPVTAAKGVYCTEGEFTNYTLQEAVDELAPLLEFWEIGTGDYSVKQKYGENTASGSNSFAVGINTVASGSASHSEGDSTSAEGETAHAEGDTTTARGQASHAEGYNNIASEDYSHVEGTQTEASGRSSHAEGDSNTSSGAAAHSEGYSNTASGESSHAEGEETTAEGEAAHSEGDATIANGGASHAEGYSTVAEGEASHTEGRSTVANNLAEHAQGQFNTSHLASATFGNAGNTIHSVGIGTSSTDRKNAIEIMQDGSIYVYNLGSYDGTSVTSVDTLQSIISELQEVSDNVLNTATDAEITNLFS